MSETRKMLPVAGQGQHWRQKGRRLDKGRLLRAIEEGIVPAEKRGARWFVEEQVGFAFTRPLDAIDLAELTAA